MPEWSDKEDPRKKATATPDMTAPYVEPMRVSTGATGGGTGFIGAQRYLQANRGAGEAMAQGVSADLANRYAADPYSEANAQRAQLAGSPAGLGTLIGDQYGRFGPYSAGMQGFDAFLAGAAGGGMLNDAARQFGTAQKKPPAPKPAEAAPVATPAPAPPTWATGETFQPSPKITRPTPRTIWDTKVNSGPKPLGRKSGTNPFGMSGRYG